jgi:hypothetical protein
MPISHIEELQTVIRRLHGTDSTHVESVPVKETFHGQTVWEGIVEVFDLHDHPHAAKVYAWSHDTEDPQKPKRHVTVLQIAPITSAVEAVRAAIIQELRSRGTAEEN